MAEAASRILSEAGLDVSNDVYDGNPKYVLVRVCKEWQADAIFLDARGLNYGNRLTLGTVTSSVRAAEAVHVRHENVGDDGVHHFAGEDLQGFDAVGGFERGVALGLKRYTQEFPVDGDVVNNEDDHSDAGECSTLLGGLFGKPSF